MASRRKEVAARYAAANQKQCANRLFIKLNGLFDTSSSFVKRCFQSALSGFLHYKKPCSSMDAPISSVQTGATLFLLVAGGGQVLDGSMSLGSFTAVNAYVAILVGVTGSLVSAGRSLLEAREADRRMDETLGLGGASSGSETALDLLSRLLGRPDPRAFIEERLKGDATSVEARFSGGERQKIALAVACGRECDLLLLDEPTATMDDASRDLVAEHLERLARDRIVVCVTHDETVLGRAGDIVRLRASPA